MPTSQLAQSDGSCATWCRQPAFRLVETEDLVALRKLLHSSLLLAQLVLPPPACAELPGDSFGSYTSGPQAHTSQVATFELGCSRIPCAQKIALIWSYQTGRVVTACTPPSKVCTEKLACSNLLAFGCYFKDQRRKQTCPPVAVDAIPYLPLASTQGTIDLEDLQRHLGWVGQAES